MANALWPASLPQYVLQSGFSETEPDTLLETQMEGGPPKSRRRYTTDYRQFTVALQMDATQRATFQTFFNTTIKGGSLPFDWVDPVTQTTASFRFRKPMPQWAVRGETHLVRFAMERIA